MGRQREVAESIDAEDSRRRVREEKARATRQEAIQVCVCIQVVLQVSHIQVYRYSQVYSADVSVYMFTRS